MQEHENEVYIIEVNPYIKLVLLYSIMINFVIKLHKMDELC